jgi:DNA-binding MarR family transcriptional regulator
MLTPPDRTPSDEDYELLAMLRHGLRRFLHWSEEQAREAGLTPAQHQLMLAVRASRHPNGPTVADVAESLLIRHHSAVGLVDRAQGAGLVERRRDRHRPALVRLRLTSTGEAKLRSLSALHLRELAQLAPTMQTLWQSIATFERSSTTSARRDPTST